VQVSAASQSAVAARHVVVEGANAFVGQVVDVPVQVSATSQTPADERHTVPALPAGCWQTALDPLQLSVVQTFPSSVQAVPFVFIVSAGHAAAAPVQFSATSHSPAADRHEVVEGANASVGQAVDVPVQVSATSQIPAAARQTVPAFPAACWQVALDPLQLSVVHTLPSSVQAVPFAFIVSAGHAACVPVQFSATSHSPAADRQEVVEGAKASVGQVRAVPLQVSVTSHVPADARHVVPLVTAEQVPTFPARLQAPQPPLQAVSQQTPFTQNPVAHCVPVMHDSANDGS